MQRPGNINGLQGFIPRNQTFGRYSSVPTPGGYSGSLGDFGKGKGIVAPPPGPGAPAPGSAPARYMGGKWVCSGDAPSQTKDGYYHCCPGGWTMTGFQTTRPCGDDFGQTICGPLPPDATNSDVACCENQREWAPMTQDGSDPCEALEMALMAQGKVVAGRAESMLAPELVIDQGPLISPMFMVAGGLAVAALFVVTIIIKLKS